MQDAPRTENNKLNDDLKMIGIYTIMHHFQPEVTIF